MNAVRDVASAVLVLGGAGLCLLAALGLLRFPDTATRLHASAKAQTVGLVLILTGTAAQVPGRYAPVVLLVALFQLLTVPVTGQIVGRTAYRTRGIARAALVRDELGDRLEREGTVPPDDEGGVQTEADR
ncbi:monovalent cation/H(+) antiporter subunit G [Streptomyces sp. NPDC048389]|uniref:monovalent cation/H(+) antiporter subunit G n=1 Tax=Streptomyces sp. NPDC048389 TaxID=3154622 RepID=UPI0034548160